MINSAGIYLYVYFIMLMVMLLRHSKFRVRLTEVNSK